MQNLLFSILYLVPKNALSRFIGRLVHLKLPEPLAGWSIRWFADRYSIDLDEAEKDVSDYVSIGDLFTRRLKAGLRPVADTKYVHPADSRLTQSAKIEDGELIQAKGKTYSVADFIGEEEAAKAFEGGGFMTYYLCPTDYHRVHSPMSGVVEKVVHIPGHLWPVNDWSTKTIDQLFAVNERLLVYLRDEEGKLAIVVFVGATNVGSMSLSFDESWKTNVAGQVMSEKTYEGVSVEKGQELGIFHMGSTVVMLYEKGMLDGLKLYSPMTVKVGEKVF